MTEAQTLETIYGQWQSGWEQLHPPFDPLLTTQDPDCVPWTKTNEDFTPDQLGELGSWVRVVVNHTTRVQATQSDPPLDEVRGNVMVSIFTPVNIGDGLAARFADEVRKILRGRFGTLNLRAGATQPGSEESNWYSIVVVIPFRYED